MNDCGECTLCCKVMAVMDLDPPKPRNDLCRFCEENAGCSVYAGRPESCRVFDCVWLQAQEKKATRLIFRGNLRPDRCHVLFVPLRGEHEGISVHVDPDYPMAWQGRAVRSIWNRVRNAGGTVVIAVGSDRIVFRKGATLPVMYTEKNPEFEV